MMLFSNLSMIGFTSFKIMNDFWVGNWAVAIDQHSRFNWYCSLIFLFAIMTSIFDYFRCGVL
jgi:hypothetical protein